MSIEATNAVWKRSRQKSGPLLVLLAIADYTNNEGDAWPAISTLARKVRMSGRNTQRCVRTLVKAGELQVRQNQGRRGSNLYRILLFGTQSNNPDAAVVGDADVGERVSCASSKDDTNVAQSVTKPLKESTPVVPSGEEVDFWAKVCFDCFRQHPRPLPHRALYKLTRCISRLDKNNAVSLVRFYRSEPPDSRKPPYNSRRHSPERLIPDLPRQLALAVQEFPPPEPPKPPTQYPFTLEELHQHLREEYGDCRLPRSLAELDTGYWPSMLPEICEKLGIKNKTQMP